MNHSDKDGTHYTITDVARISGLPESTLRYYESQGVIKAITRHPNTKRRVYSKHDLDEITTVACLNAVGFSIKDIKTYLHNRKHGVERADAQARLLMKQSARIREKLQRTTLQLSYIDHKHAYWKAIRDGDTSSVRIVSKKIDEIMNKLHLPR